MTELKVRLRILTQADDFPRARPLPHSETHRRCGCPLTPFEESWVSKACRFDLRRFEPMGSSKAAARVSPCPGPLTNIH